MSIDVPYSYWTNESLLITVRNGHGAHQFSLERPFALLGKHADCDLVLEGDGIEDRSMVITLAPTAIYGIVLCATAKKAGRVFSLEENRVFKLGRCEISVSRQGAPDPPRVESHNAENVSVISWKTKRGRLHAQLTNHRPMVLGRREPAQIVVEDDAVSGVHCCLYRSNSELWAIDLCSSHGTWRKGESVRVARLDHGKSVTAGGTRLHFLNFHAEDVVASLSSTHVEQLRSFEDERANWLQHRTVLLSSLGQLHDGLDRQNVQAEEEGKLLLARIRELESQLAAEASRYDQLAAEQDTLRVQFEQQTRDRDEISLARIREMEAQLAAETSRYKELIAEHNALRGQHEQTNRELHEKHAARIEELESQLTAEKSHYDELAAEHDALRSQHERTNQELDEKQAARIEELGSQLAAESNRHQQLVAQHKALLSRHQRTSRELDQIREQHVMWKSRQAQARYDLEERDRILKSVEMDTAKRELELIAMKAKLRKEQEEFELLRRQAIVAGEIPSIFESFSAGHEGSSKVHDETCISSPNFARILDEAIESQRPGQDG